MRNVVKQDWITRKNLQDNPDCLYVFGDNDLRKGLGGQAKSMRGEPNAIGIRTKHLPALTPNSFWSDSTYSTNIRKIEEDLLPLFSHKGTVVLPSQGIGTGLAKLAITAPKTFEYLQNRLNDLSKELS